MTKKYLTEAEVAEMTSRSKGTLRNDRWKKTGIPYIKASRSVRYDVDAVVAWMESQTVRTTN